MSELPSLRSGQESSDPQKGRGDGVSDTLAHTSPAEAPEIQEI